MLINEDNKINLMIKNKLQMMSAVDKNNSHFKLPIFKNLKKNILNDRISTNKASQPNSPSQINELNETMRYTTESTHESIITTK